MAIELKTGKYKIYHIPGKKIGCTTNIEKRVQQEQGYKPGEYEILFETDDIKEASEWEEKYGDTTCLLYTSPRTRDKRKARMPASA